MAEGNGSVLLYVPNIICYCRLLVLFYAIPFAFSEPKIFVALTAVSIMFDAVDGWAARKLDQTSSFGAILDIFCDIITRSALWMIVLTTDRSLLPLTLFIVSLEWSAFFSTQYGAMIGGGAHWKQQRASDPAPVAYFFSNNFRNPLGAIGILGLYGSPLLMYLKASQLEAELAGLLSPTMLLLVEVMMHGGRFVCVVVELWLVMSFCLVVSSSKKVSEDSRRATKEA